MNKEGVAIRTEIPEEYKDIAGNLRIIEEAIIKYPEALNLEGGMRIEEGVRDLLELENEELKEAANRFRGELSQIHANFAQVAKTELDNLENQIMGSIEKAEKRLSQVFGALGGMTTHWGQEHNDKVATIIELIYKILDQAKKNVNAGKSLDNDTKKFIDNVANKLDLGNIGEDDPIDFSEKRVDKISRYLTNNQNI